MASKEDHFPFLTPTATGTLFGPRRVPLAAFAASALHSEATHVFGAQRRGHGL